MTYVNTQADDDDEPGYGEPSPRAKTYKKKYKKRPEPFDESQELTEAQIERFRQRFKNSAYWYLERGDKTRKELEDRMRRKVDFPAALIPGVLDDLERDGDINDTRYAANFIYSRTEYRKQGKNVIRMELIRKGVAADIVDEALADWDAEEEIERAKELIAKKIRTTRGMEYQKRTNQIVGMLARRGYPMGSAFGLVKDAIREDEELREAEALEAEAGA